MTALMVTYQISLGMLRAALVGRVVLYIVVCWNMYQGRNWARVAFLVLMLAGSLNFAVQIPRDPFQLVYALAYASIGAVVLRSRSVQAYFAFKRLQRMRLPTPGRGLTA